MGQKKGTRTAKYVKTLTIATSADWRFHATTATYIYICTGPADARPAWPDLQTHGRTHRRAGHAEARMDTQKCRRRRTDANTSARWCTDAKYSCVQCVGGKIFQTCPASGRTRKDLRDVLYVYEAVKYCKIL